MLESVASLAAVPTWRGIRSPFKLASGWTRGLVQFHGCTKSATRAFKNAVRQNPITSAVDAARFAMKKVRRAFDLRKHELMLSPDGRRFLFFERLRLSSDLQGSLPATTSDWARVPDTSPSNSHLLQTFPRRCTNEVLRGLPSRMRFVWPSVCSQRQRLHLHPSCRHSSPTMRFCGLYKATDDCCVESTLVNRRHSLHSMCA